MIARLFHGWERRLASVDTNRRVRPFAWGLEWIGLDPASADPCGDAVAWSRRIMTDTDRFFEAAPRPSFECTRGLLRFPSAVTTPHPVNNAVAAQLFPARGRRADRHRAVLVLPQWNADAGGHAGLCQLLASRGVTALRLTLPYHDVRRPPHLERADYIVSANVGRTLQVNRQAVLDARNALDWLNAEGYDRVGIMGTSLGSCLAMLAMAHDARIRTGVFNHVSPYFADVVWEGLSTAHVRAGLDGHVTLDELRACWMPISPWPFIERVRDRRMLFIYARYDLTFPVPLSRHYLTELSRRGIARDVAVLPCGHYTTGRTPFKFLDAYHLIRFLLPETCRRQR